MKSITIFQPSKTFLLIVLIGVVSISCKETKKEEASESMSEAMYEEDEDEMGSIVDIAEENEDWSTLVSATKASDFEEIFATANKAAIEQMEQESLKIYNSSVAVNSYDYEVDFSGLPHMNMLKDRTYVKNAGIDVYRDKLELLLGRIVYKSPNGMKVGGIQFSKDDYKPKVETPKNGELESHIYKDERNTSFGLFIGVNLNEKEIANYTVTDILKAVLDSKYIDDKKLVNGITAMRTLAQANDEKMYLISGITVTEITSKKFKEKGNKITVNNLPSPASAFSFENKLYTSNTSFKRTYQVGLSVTDLDVYVAERNLEAELTPDTE
ncbi:hypothetical protein AAU57_08760 [Nonlabens sp. YIK11]|uniref:hypothetical protein n=1 Tax=Nonlabens sp. YIK11 TaxID=1453349 RepID=UPI0006DC8012|nr:hypothetical protein [Nonlabens sp. YIK11]KQC33393.1 hypothetical protein AAU57_08760 [Nonlabens sp. YIK11]